MTWQIDPRFSSENTPHDVASITCQQALVGGKGTKVALACNTSAALNDITHVELAKFLDDVAGPANREGDPILVGPSRYCSPRHMMAFTFQRRRL